MKALKLLNFSMLTFLSLNFCSCSQVTDYMKKVFNSERPPENTIPRSEVKSKVKKEDNNTTPEKKQSKPLLFLRGNKVSLLKAKNYPKAYALSMQGVGNQVLAFTNTKGVDTSSSYSLMQLIQNWNNNKSVSANLVLLRNLSNGNQKDVAIDLELASPRFNTKTNELSFLVKPRTYINDDYLGENIGSAILLFESAE